MEQFTSTTDRSIRIQRICVGVVFVMLFLFAGLRWNVGTDTWHTYTPEYLAMKSEQTDLSQEESLLIDDCYRLWARMEMGLSKEKAELLTHEEALSFFKESSSHTSVGFRAMEMALIFLGADVQWLYVVTSLFILAFVFAVIHKQSNAIVLAAMMFVLTGSFFLSLNIVSQFMAISVCLFACTYAQERKPILFFLLIALAACFHVSALVFIPVYILPKLNIRPIWCFVAVAFTLIVSQFCFPIIEKIVAAVVPAYARYFSHESDFELIFFAIGLAVLAVGTYYFPKGKDKPYYRLWFYANVIGLIALSFSGHIPYMKRINYYYAAPHFLFLPLVIQCEEKPSWRKAMTAIMVVLFVAETIVATYILNKNGILPYQTFFWGSRTSVTEGMLEYIPGLWAQ
ncbi:MAG: EpsG family protein [Lachnospiraceae bacterium]|nr:EpsG family protein [Lachnospiraceae bacterium]